MSQICTTPWRNLFLQWERVTVCCNLTSSVFVPTKPWEAWDNLEAVVERNGILNKLRDDMRNGTAACLHTHHKCRSCRFDDAYDLLQPPRWENVSISVSSLCGAQCIYCALWHPARQPSPPEPTLQQIGKLALSLAKHPIRSVYFTGGDLLAMSDEAIESYLSISPTASMQIVTNGLGLTEDRWLRYFQRPKLTVRVTLDTLDPDLYVKMRGPFGDTPVHTKIAQIVDTYGGGDRISIGATINTCNLGGISDLIRFAGEHKISRVWLNPVDYGRRKSPQACFARENLDHVTAGELWGLINRWEDLGRECGVTFGPDLQRLRTVLKTNMGWP
jgi:uncharacterized radical SAM superfamily Fe-S cluster-containing enzyme